MEKIKCIECGSGNIVKSGEFYICENCNTMYRFDGMESKLENDVIAETNTDEFFRSSHYIESGHNSKLSVDLHLLQNPEIKDISNVVDSLVEKTEIAIEEVFDINDKDKRNKALLNVIEEFNTKCYSICEEVIWYNQYKLGWDSIFGWVEYSINKAYIDVHNTIIDCNGCDDNLKTVFRYLDILKNELLDKIHRIDYDIRHGELYKARNNAKQTKNAKQPKKIVRILGRILGGYVQPFSREYMKEKGKHYIVIFFPFVACLFFLVLGFISIRGNTGKEDELRSVFYFLSSIACGYGVYEIYKFEDEVPVAIRTLIWLIILWFAFFDFGTGLFIVWRMLIGIALIVITFIVFVKYLNME